MNLVFALLIFVFLYWPNIENRQSYEAYFGFLFLILIIATELFRKIHWSVGITFFLFSFSAINGLFFPTYYPIPIDASMLNSLSGEISYSLICLILYATVLLTQKKRLFNELLLVLFWASFIDSGVIIFKTIVYGQNYGMLNNKAADASFIACMLPFAFDLRNIFIIPPILILAILMTKSSTGIAGIGLAIAFTLLHKMPFKKWIMLMIPITLSIVIGSHFYLGNELLFTSGRAQKFKEAWEFYRNYTNPWFGAGTGTYTVWGEAYQLAHHDADLWSWLHNDWLEVLFENGIIGIGLSVGVFGFLIRRLFLHSSLMFPVAIIYGATAITEMPLRLFVTQMLGVSLLAIAFKKEPYNA